MRATRKMPAAERAVAWLYDHRWLSLAACLLVTGLAGWQATGVAVDNALEMWFLEDDPALTAYRDLQTAFGNDEMVVVAVSAEGGRLLSPAGLDMIRAATIAVAGVPEVAEVRSLTTVPDVLASPTGLQVVPLVPEGELSEGQLEALRQRLLADPLVRGKLLNSDGSVAVLLVRLQALGDIDARRGAILHAIDQALDRVDGLGAAAVSGTGRTRFAYRKAGVGVIYEGLNRASTEDSALFIVASYILIAGLLWAIYRRLLPTAVSLVGAGVASTWALGLYGACGRDINMVSMVMPTLVFIIGLADSVHILMFVARLPKGDDRRHRIVHGVGHMLRPCLFNTLTTAGAFGSFAASRMAVLRDFGLFAAAGLLCAFVTTLVTCVWALHWQRVEPRLGDGRLLERLVSAVAAVGIERPRTVLAGAGVLAVLAAVSASRIEVDTNSIDFLPEQHVVRQEAAFVESRFGPFTPLEMVVAADAAVGEGSALRPDVLRAVGAWQRRVEAAGLAGWSFSVADSLERLAEATGWSSIPQSADAVALLGEAYRKQAPEDYARWVDRHNRLRVSFGIPMQSAKGLGARLEAIKAAAALPGDVSLTATGYIPLYVQMMDYVVETQISSFLLAFAVTFLLIGLLFRSGRAVLLAVPSNVLPVLLVLGLMGLTGIRLDVATVTIGAIVLGLVVDDTVHLLHQLRHEIPLARDPREGLRRAVNKVGLAMLTTTVVLSFGFAVLGLAQVKSVAYFGILLAAALVSALAADLLVTPALVAVFQRHQPADPAH